MNNWHTEFMAEYHRQDILNEAEQIHLEKIIQSSRVYRPGLFAQSMFKLANWMISTGKQLRKRYEIPTVNCSNSTTESYVS